MTESAPSGSRRPYNSPARRQRAAETRDRIVAAGAELVREFVTWDWDGLTFRAVAERAGVSERTAYRHFPTERQLHDAVMARLEDEAGITYRDVDLGNLASVTERFFASLHGFAVRETVRTPVGPAFVGAVEDARFGRPAKSRAGRQWRIAERGEEQPVQAAQGLVQRWL